MTRRTILTPDQRALLLSLLHALFGLAIAIAAYPLWMREAPAGQLPGFATLNHFDAHAPMRFFLSVVVFPFAAAFALRPLAGRLARADARAWARNAEAAAIFTSLWTALISHSLAWTIVPVLAVMALVALLRRTPLRFSIRDAVLLPAALAVFVALLDVTTLTVDRATIVAAALVFALRVALAIPLRRSAPSPSLLFTFAPLGLFSESHLIARDLRYAGWPALVIALASPIVLRLLLRNTPAVRRRLRLALVLVVYPLAIFSYASATSLIVAEGKPRVDFFEDAQHVTPAAEILRGETPYRDIVPPHGFIQDALFDIVAFDNQRTIGSSLYARANVAGAGLLVLYLLAFAANGSADVALLALLFGMTLGITSVPIRFLPSVLTVALACWGVRLRRLPWLVAAGAAAAVAVLTSIDLGAYAAVTLFAAAMLFRGRRLRALGAATTGAAAIAVPAAIAMAVHGFLTDFLRVTLFEVATLGPVYALTPWHPPKALDRNFPELLAAVTDVDAFFYCVWIATLAGLAALLARGRTRRERALRAGDPLLVTAVWILVSGISYAERHHVYARIVAPAFVAALAWRLFRARPLLSRIAARALLLVLLIVAQLTGHIAIDGWIRRARGPIDSNYVEIGLPRARGARFARQDAAIIDTVHRYVSTHLRPDETFFDFTNRGFLYYLLDRDCPIRNIEVAFYETEERQREVIARIEGNPRIRAALLPPPPEQEDRTAVDLVPNPVRAPLVFQYLQQHFEPAVEEGPVIIWRRK
jgi:hypothetical protein